MCGVFGVTNYVMTDLEERFGVESEPREEELKSHFQPHSKIPTISRNSPNKLIFREWSLLPNWIRQFDDLKFPTFNARSETIREKPSFRNAWQRSQRCLIVASEFYEFKDNGKGKKKTPFKFSMGGKLFAMAGLYEDRADFQTTTIITRAASEQSKEIHDRLPVIIAKSDEEMWLDPNADLEKVYELISSSHSPKLNIEEVLT